MSWGGGSQAKKKKKRVKNKEIKQSISVAGCCAFLFFKIVTESIRVKCNGVSEDDKTMGEWSNVEKWFPGERCSPAV